jgi:hypothetical protein
MNKYQLHTLGGALLASTALAGTAYAGTVGTIAVSLGAAGSSISATTQSIANTIFSATAATANAISFRGASDSTSHLAVAFTNRLSIGSVFNATIDFTGATLVTTSAPSIDALVSHNGATTTFTATIGAPCASSTPLVNKILLSGCLISATTTAALGGNGTVAFIGGLQLSGVVFNNASGLATAGGTVSVSGTVYDNANPTIVIEQITSGAVITSANPTTTTVTAGATATTNAATTPTAFSAFQSPFAGGLTMTLATVAITSNGALGTNLASIVVPDGATGVNGASSVAITVTSAALSDDAATSATLSNPGGAANLVTLTPAAFSAGVATFNLNQATSTYTGANSVQTVSLVFSGTTAINQAAAGTVAVAYGLGGAGGNSVVASASASGVTAAIANGGFQAEFNTAQATGGDFASYIRIHNNGAAAGAVTFTVLNDATGASLGTYTTGSIAVGQTLQVDMPTIETGASITSPSGQYTLQLAGPIVGYAQHVLYNATTGQFTDLSSFRNAGSTAANP